MPSISKDPKIISVSPPSTASSGFRKQWHYQHHWITSCVTNSNDKNLCADAFLNPGSVSPHSCCTLFLLGGWSVGSVLFGLIFVSITCSSMKNDRQIFAAPSQFVCSFVWGPHCLSVLLADCTSLCALDVLHCQTWWISYERAYNHDWCPDIFLFFLILICMSCPFFSSLPLDAHLSFVLMLNCLNFSSHFSLLFGSQISLLSHIALPHS